MLKVAVFDNGWGGELVADYLLKELKTIEVIRVIDWQNSDYSLKSPYEIYQLARLQLEPYINKVDLIVLGGYTISLAYSYLAKEFPGQKIVGMTIDSYHFPQSYRNVEQIALLASETMIVSGSVFQELHTYFPNSNLIAPDCSGWEELINLGEMTAEVLRFELQDYFHLTKPSTNRLLKTPSLATSYDIIEHKPRISASLRQQVRQFLASNYAFNPVQFAVAHEMDGREQNYCAGASNYTSDDYNKISLDEYGLSCETLNDCLLLKPRLILLLNTHFWDIRPELETVFGSDTIIVDFRQKLLHDVCLALGLRGVDGQLGRNSGRSSAKA